MEMIKLVLFSVVMTGWYRNTRGIVYAIDLCKFASKFPLNENEAMQPYTHFADHTGRTPSGTGMSSLPPTVQWNSEPSDHTSATFKSTFGQSTERQSSSMFIDNNHQTLITKATTNKENSSFALTANSTSSFVADHTRRTPSGAGMPSLPPTVEWISKPLDITSATFKSTFGESTERKSSPQFFDNNGQTLITKATTNKENSSLAATANSTSTTPDCPPNMVYTLCDECESTCQQPSVCVVRCISSEVCVCPKVHGFLMKDDDCVPAEECGCFIQGRGVIPNNGYYISDDCSNNCVCLNDDLQCYPYLNCSENATCAEQDGVGRCYCNQGFEGDGETCLLRSTFTDCNDAQDAGYTQDGVYSITPHTWVGPSFEVYCNMATDGGGWTVFQRRLDGSTDFYKSWDEYKEGFGDNRHEFWLGNEKLYHILQQAEYEVRVNTVMSVNGTNVYYYHKYANFKIDNEINHYRVIDRGQWSGLHGGAMYMVKNMNFSTYDRDNDGLSYNCAVMHRGGWWYGGVEWSFDFAGNNCRFWLDGLSSIRSCTGANPNGVYNGSNGQTIFLDPHFCHVYYLEMKVRRTV